MATLLDVLVSTRYLSWAPAWVAALIPPLGMVLLYALVSRLPRSARSRERGGVLRIFLRRTRPPIYLLLAVATADWSFRRLVALQAWPWAGRLIELMNRITPLLIVTATAFLTVRIVRALFEVLRERFDLNVADNLRARRATTQLLVLERVVTTIVLVVALSLFLMTIPEVRQYGASLLASAGVAGLVVGLAAQQTIANVLAGIQIAITQPVRIDDAVVIDGEWGRIEEITLTYVVVRVWDKRRLVVPITYLLQHPFQNWTRTNASIIGTVFLHVDYTCDIDALRKAQSSFLAASPLWDGEVDVIQVTEAGERTVQLRSLVSAADSGQAWDLRTEVREHLIRYLRQNQPTALPRQRMRLTGSVIAGRPGEERDVREM